MLKRQILALALLSSLLLATHAQPKSDPVLAPFQIEYKVKKKGMSLGVAEVFFRPESDNPACWRHSTSVEPSGFISLFTSRSAYEYALVRFDNNTVSPEYFYREKKSGKKSETIKTLYDYQFKKATAETTTRKGTRENTLELNQTYYDTQSFQAALIVDMQSSIKEKNYRLWDKGEVKDYKVLFEGKETLSTKTGKYETLKLIQTQGNRKTVSWHAPTLNYAAVKITRYRKNKIDTEMLIKKVIQPNSSSI